MKTSTIKISKAVDDFGDSVNEFILCLYQIQKDAPQNVIFDFSDCTFLTPYITGGIVSLTKSLTERKCNVEFLRPKDPAMLSYFDTIYFPEGVDFVGSSPETINRNLMRFHTKSYLPIVCFPVSYADAEIRVKIMTAINTILRNQLKLDGYILQAITYMIDELTQNIVDHSKSPQGMIVAEYYPDKHYMDLCIADWGKGVFKSYIDSGKFKPEDNVEAMEYAVKGKSTKNLPESRGFGLSTSRKMLVHGLQGMFFILSGDSFFLELPDWSERVVEFKDLDYKGCYVALRIPLQTVENFDFYKFVE